MDEVVGDDVPRSFLVKTHEAWHVLKLVVRGGHLSSWRRTKIKVINAITGTCTCVYVLKYLMLNLLTFL